MTAQLASFTLDDDLSGAADGAIEVTVTLRDGRRRWCFFMTPEALGRCGDWLPGTQVRIHFDASHMIVLSRLDADLIDRALRLIDQQGRLEACTLPLQAG